MMQKLKVQPRVKTRTGVDIRAILPTPLQQLVTHLVWRLGVARRTQIADLVYLVDFLHSRSTGTSYTNAMYCREEHGPVPVGFDDVIGSLNGFELLIDKTPADGVGHVTLRRGADGRFQPCFPQNTCVVVDHVLSTFGSTSLRSLSDFVNYTSPMREILAKERRGKRKALGAKLEFPLYPASHVLEKYTRVLSALDLTETGSEEARSQEELDLYFELQNCRRRASASIHDKDAC